MLKKNFKYLLLVMTMILAVLSCGKSGAGEAGTSGEKNIKVGVIYTKAKLGGNSFNDLVLEGVKRAEADFGIKYNNVEPNTAADQENAQETMASSGEYALIIVVGQEQMDVLKKTAEKYPDQKFAYIDGILDMPNIASYEAKEQEGSFLVGVLAALSKEKKIDPKFNSDNKLGFIGGVNSPLINKFYTGYTAGIRYINPSYAVTADYVGGFNDPSTGKVIASTMNQKGNDVIYHAAGASGTGLFQAAEEKGFIAIGVNSNQNTLAPNNIIATMIKKVDVAAYSAIKDVTEGKFSQGKNILGLKEDGVGYTTEGSNIKVPQEIIDEVEKIKQKIISGELVIPDKPENVDEFLKNNTYSK